MSRSGFKRYLGWSFLHTCILLARWEAEGIQEDLSLFPFLLLFVVIISSQYCTHWRIILISNPTLGVAEVAGW